METKQTNKFFLDRWGPDAVDLGYAMVPNAFIDKIHTLGLNATQALTLIVLMRHWYSSNPRVFKKKIADSLGISPKQVGKVLLTLEANGLLARHYRKKEGNEQENDSTEFDLSPLVIQVASHAKLLNEAKKESRKLTDKALAKKKGA